MEKIEGINKKYEYFIRIWSVINVISAGFIKSNHEAKNYVSSE